MLLSRRAKIDLKQTVIEAIEGKLPLTVETESGTYRIEVATTHMRGDAFINMKVKDLNGNLITYLTASVKESL